MHEPNQGLPDELAPVEAGDSRPPSSDLRPWFVIVTVAGIGALFMGHAELAALAALAGLFAVAHAADLDPSRQTTYRALAWVVPAGSVWAFAILAYIVWPADVPASSRTAGLVVIAVGAAASLVAGLRAPADLLARRLFRVVTTSRVERLAARLAVLGVLFSVPAGIAFPIAAEQLAASGDSLVGDASSLWGNLGGLVLLSLGAVGFTVRRDLRATLERLGIASLRLPDAAVIVGGVIVLVAVNAVAEWIQRSWFHGLWVKDQAVNQMIVGTLTRPEILLLGLSAGVGEEVALRGTLQPRLGIFRTSILFALLHVQYSWFGMAIIAALGLVLGWIRRRTCTSAAILVHVLYDVVAAATAKG